MKRVILDTNLLIYCLQNRINLLEELNRVVGEGFELEVPEAVLKELKRLRVKEAKLALSFIQTEEFSILLGNGHADDVIFNAAQAPDVIVATNDVALKERLASTNVRTISVKSKNKLAFI